MPTLEQILRVAASFPQMLAYLDSDYVYQYANRSYSDFIGKNSKDLIGCHVSDVIEPAEVYARVKSVLDRAMQGENQSYEANYNGKWAKVDVIPQTGENGLEVVGCYVVANDITAIKNAVDVSAHYQAVVDASLDGIIIIDEFGTVRNFNPAAERLFGYTAAEVVGQNIKMLMPQHHSDRHDGYLAAYVAGHGGGRVIGTAGVEAEGKRKDGTTFPAELSVSEFRSGRGRAFTGTVRDITQRKRWESELRGLNEQLEARVEERTRDLRIAHETLRQSQKMEAIGQLTGGIAHDFNNLLAGVIGCLDILQNRIASGQITTIEQGAKYHNGALESAKKAAALTQRMLAFARRQPLEPRVIDPNGVLSSMEELVSRTIGQIDFEISPQASFAIKCDRNQLENGILNLVLNSRDASPEGGHICVSTRDVLPHETAEYDVPAGEYVRITVRDEGPGMTDEIKQRAFDPFYTTKPIGEGTGLGLSMVYGFVTQSDGFVRIDSKVGEGTAVHIFLPREVGIIEKDHNDTGSVPVVGHTGMVILVVEDEPIVREVVADTLSGQGFIVLEADDAYKALEIIRTKQRIDLMVSDVGLPGMNGRQLAEEARFHRPGLGVLFVTGYAQNVLTHEDILQPGMQLMTKPFSVDALAGRVIEMVG